MSIHPSLKGVDTLTGERSVLTRYERIQKLSKDGKIDPASDSPLGLPKVRTHFKIAGAKKKKADDEQAGGAAEGEASTPAGE